MIYDWAGQDLQNGTLVDKPIPPQFSNELEADIFEAFEETFETIETGYFSSDYVLNALIAGALQYFWSMVVSQQIIIMMPLFAVNLPANTQSMFNVMFQIAAFDMIPTDDYYEEMLEKLGSSAIHDYLHEKMEVLGFDTNWLLPNLGSAILFFGLYPCMVAYYLALKCLSEKCKVKSCRRRRIAMRGVVFWNWPISFFRDSYVVIAICTIYNIKYARWNPDEAATNSGLAFALLGFLILQPLVLQLFLYCKRD